MIKKAFENIVEKEEGAGNKHCVVFPSGNKFEYLSRIYIVVYK